MLSALQHRKQMFLVQVQLQEVVDGYEIRVDRNARVATTAASRKRFEQDRTSWRFAAGGGLLILDCKDRSVALVRYRDSAAPSYANHWTLGSGVSSSVEELADIERTVVREACEEFIIATPAGVVIPTFDDARLDQVAYGAVGTTREARSRPGIPSVLATDHYVEIKASFEPLADEKTLVVFLPDAAPRSYTGIVQLDQGTRGLDLLKRIRLSIPFMFDELAILDGEENPNGEPLDSPIGCLSVDTFGIGKEFFACYKSGARTDMLASFNPRTPTLEAMLSAH